MSADASDRTDTGAIRAEIEETRERMSQTIGAIGERLNPQVLKDNVKESIREATIGRVSQMAQNAANSVSRSTSGITDTIRENPIPAAMVAIGLGWLVLNRRSPDDNRWDSSSRRGASRSGEMYRSGMSPRFGGDQYNLAEESDSTIDRVRGRASELGDAAREQATHLADRAQETAESVKQGAQDVAGSVARTTRRSAGRVEDAFYENPMVIGSLAMAIGLASGFAAPVTDREVRLMGDARDDIVDRVKEIAEETKDKAEHVVERVVAETKTAAREEGLTG